MVHFNWLQLLPNIDHSQVHVATAVASTGVLCVLGVWGNRALANSGTIIPAGHFSIRGLFEAFIQFIVGLVDMVMGSEGRKFTPLFASLFLFIFVNNLVGLIPGMTPATDNLNLTLAAGVGSFIVYNFFGITEHGVAYVKQFLGPLIFLAPLMFFVELISHLVRPLSLGLRLQGNMQGDHIVLSVFTDLIPYVVPIPFYFLGLFVCFMQAFVFTLLNMIYVSLAISHDH